MLLDRVRQKHMKTEKKKTEELMYFQEMKHPEYINKAKMIYYRRTRLNTVFPLEVKFLKITFCPIIHPKLLV